MYLLAHWLECSPCCCRQIRSFNNFRLPCGCSHCLIRPFGNFQHGLAFTVCHWERMRSTPDGNQYRQCPSPHRKYPLVLHASGLTFLCFVLGFCIVMWFFAPWCTRLLELGMCKFMDPLALILCFSVTYMHSVFLRAIFMPIRTFWSWFASIPTSTR